MYLYVYNGKQEKISRNNVTYFYVKRISQNIEPRQGLKKDMTCFSHTLYYYYNNNNNIIDYKQEWSRYMIISIKHKAKKRMTEWLEKLMVTGMIRNSF